ncbi:hypothetical protein Daura_16225 [Dactylosporangium aurantiacum]|uniref:Tetratricopeptide repeat protein n=1 Tax=Dactylosporangium aurantiacum TaxID=35754 RepID=A0A9Q9MK38_9ACTN|nr:hypothetical protein [Dactylosporangium aurantiacum]MDG6103053.1 hypothetical protein [Dactylosporangium aurantiacum]UWZ57565.1 hypothetical protein Daura_16225 [Dactylosporangium aurantiacum]
MKVHGRTAKIEACRRTILLRPRAGGPVRGAQRLYRRALDGRRRTCGAEHPEVALTLDNLAALAAFLAER